ncbi:RND transporter [Klebsiella quasipneumoniae]|uniref:RND transporter n=1 Tax=Klebsiella quasipneumoniae TaxID=1463165 RepID=UPI000B4143C0|nr:RND transporter [Klebsiella quasipneumoniae]MDJ1029701.1 RND transporter [Klebsiella quasipneumoniae]RNT44557.1 RND transporter [Klebsiella quasipneumoniae subsp. quasipneumoniae]UMD15217.1 RND transporter [Klebsiella quasipneumoniae]HBQ3013511.1 RND transporter [Klebsiella quasipneumoniae subsp. quasipneumoniae]HBW1844220.1 RND transporter [Klebsiella quasipneumoniae subsp. quasipneumoniae]
MKKISLPLLLLTALASPTFAADCQPNGIGGSFCINDDGTTTDTVPNEVNGMDTYSNNGGYSSSLPDQSGAEEALEGSTLSTQQDSVDSSGQGDSALAGRDWHSPSNLNDGAATSSMSLLDKP